MKVVNVKLDENNVFTSGSIIDDCTTSLNADLKKEYAKEVKRAEKEGLPEPEKPLGIDVPATLVVDLTGAKLEDVLKYVHSPRRISQQNVWKNTYEDAEAFDKALRGNEFTIPAVAEGREKLSTKDKVLRAVKSGALSREELMELLAESEDTEE